jgi:hypothetical protein
MSAACITSSNGMPRTRPPHARDQVGVRLSDVRAVLITHGTPTISAWPNGSVSRPTRGSVSTSGTGRSSDPRHTIRHWKPERPLLPCAALRRPPRPVYLIRHGALRTSAVHDLEPSPARPPWTCLADPPPSRAHHRQHRVPVPRPQRAVHRRRPRHRHRHRTHQIAPDQPGLHLGQYGGHRLAGYPRCNRGRSHPYRPRVTLATRRGHRSSPSPKLRRTVVGIARPSRTTSPAVTQP